MRAVDQCADGFEPDIHRHDEHGDDDPCLSTALEVFRCDWIGSFLPEPPHEHDRGGRVEQGVQSEPSECKAARRESDDQGSRSDDTVPDDREVREPERGTDQRVTLGVGKRSGIGKQ